jgi:nucleotide-binding universal stress UspA family protein
MGTHGRTGLSKMLLGSVTDKVIAGSQCPVLVVHDTGELPDRILVPVDFGESSSRAMMRALELARAIRSEVHVLYAWAPVNLPAPITPAMSTASVPSLSHPLYEMARQQATQSMTEFLEAHLPAFPDVRVQSFIEMGEPRQQIPIHAREHACQWIIMGTHGRKGLARWVLGSVAEHVLAHSDLPVMVVPVPRGGRDDDGPPDFYRT